MQIRRARGHSRTRGQALVEFALVAPLFFLLLFGLIDGARFVYTATAYGQAAREGARWGSVQQWFYTCPGSVSPKTRKLCTQAVTRTMVPAGAPAPVTITASWNPCTAGQILSVQVRAPFNFFVPFIGDIFGNPTVDQTAQVAIQ